MGLKKKRDDGDLVPGMNAWAREKKQMDRVSKYPLSAAPFPLSTVHCPMYPADYPLSPIPS